jgi:hypothetical protein
MAFNVEAAKAAGYTDAEIQEFLSKEPVVEPEEDLDSLGAPPPPPGFNKSIVEEKIVEEKIVEEYDPNAPLPPPGPPIQPIEPSMAEKAITYGGTAAAIAAPVVPAYYGAKILKNALRPKTPPVTSPVTGSGPVKPQVSNILGADGRPMPRTNVAPSKAAAEVAEAQLKARGAQISNFARNYALLKSGAKTALRGAKFIPGAGLVAGGGMGLYDAYQGFNADPNADLGENLANAGSSALSGVTFGLLGTDPDEIAQQSSTFPLTGPAKDIKINQQTGQPWTRQELDAYYTQFPE